MLWTKASKVSAALETREVAWASVQGKTEAGSQ